MLISDAYAQAADSAQSGAGWANLILLIGLFLVFYLLLIRPQAKRAKEHKQMVENLQRGDEVITNGGILGLILNVSESYVVVEISQNLEVIVLKSSIQTLLPKGTLKSIEPKGIRQQKSKAGKGAAPLEEKDDSEKENTSDTASPASSESGQADAAKSNSNDKSP